MPHRGKPLTHESNGDWCASIDIKRMWSQQQYIHVRTMQRMTGEPRSRFRLRMMELPLALWTPAATEAPVQHHWPEKLAHATWPRKTMLGKQTQQLPPPYIRYVCVLPSTLFEPIEQRRNRVEAAYLGIVYDYRVPRYAAQPRDELFRVDYVCKHSDGHDRIEGPIEKRGLEQVTLNACTRFPKWRRGRSKHLASDPRLSPHSPHPAAARKAVRARLPRQVHALGATPGPIASMCDSELEAGIRPPGPQTGKRSRPWRMQYPASHASAVREVGSFTRARRG